MSATIVAKDLAAAFGARPLFSGLDLAVAPGDVIGLVGANGAGKSTLLRMLAGLIAPDAGAVSISPPAAPIGYLPQLRVQDPGETVLGALHRRTGVADAQLAMDAAAQRLADGEPGADDAYGAALELWLALGGADLDDRVPAALDQVGLQADPGAAMGSLSGGQAARVGLASLLLARFEAFLLDEPTNDLDLAGLATLERFVGQLRAPVVVVSHDREFLSRTVNAVLELDLAQQQVALYGGGYDAYLQERAVARRHAREAYEEYADRRAALTDRARTQRAWMETGVRNARRKAPDNDKIGRKFRSETTEKQAAKARQTERLIERLDVVEEPRKEWELQMSIAAAPRSGAVVVAADRAVARRGDFTLGPVTLQLDFAERVAITGPNGAGKTTLLSLLLGRIAPQEGRVSLGSGVVIGEVDQARSLLDDDGPAGGPAASLAARMGQLLPDLPDADVRTLLAKFGLRADHVTRAPGTLSPGERTRAALALLQARGVNLLVLDEPTNHLDLPAIEQLEGALDSFAGTLLLVTHDRRMIDAVRITQRWEIREGAVTITSA